MDCGRSAPLVLSSSTISSCSRISGCVLGATIILCNQRPSESVIHSPRTARVRKLVMESGPQRLGRWLDYERDIRADFEKAFGEPPGALVAVGIMTDTDNTGETAQAWYGPLALGTATKGN
ncbi:MAG: DUF3047 domain-containing protein [Betaproteobacteria bacterium]|nr:DUF3047 domain-containing protein [Betaproteobacteria bacterium]